MTWRRTPFSSLYLRTLFSRCLSSSSSIPPHFHPNRQLIASAPSFLSAPFCCWIPAADSLLLPSPVSFSAVRSFSSDSDSFADLFNDDPEDPVARSLSFELLKDTSEPAESLPLPQRLDLSFSHISVTPSLILRTLNISPEAGRAALGFLIWVRSRQNFDLTDEILSYFIDYFGRRKDFKAAADVFHEGRGIAGRKSLESMVDRLVRAGRPIQVVSLFDKVGKAYGFTPSFDTLKLFVFKLCEHGYGKHAEEMVKKLANRFFPDEEICDALIKGWCVDGKLEEASRLAEEMYRGGFEISTKGYNAILDCVCKLCRNKNPASLTFEAQKVLVKMEEMGVPRNVETFNVLIGNLCKIRMTNDAMSLFQRMGEWGCYPTEETFLLLIRSLYQAARVGEGDEMIAKMKAAGYADALGKKEYYGFLKILCGIERIDHAMSVFAQMKEDGCTPGVKTYDLLMCKLCAHGRVDKANALYKEAESRGVPVTPKPYKLDPRFVKRPKVVKKEKKRETLPEKMARKRRTLRKINLSFVRKPKKMMRRSF